MRSGGCDLPRRPSGRTAVVTVLLGAGCVALGVWLYKLKRTKF